jgi:hypothetical protein
VANDRKLNTLGSGLLLALAEAFAAVPASARAVVLTGEGARALQALSSDPTGLLLVGYLSASAAVSASYRESFAGAETARAIRPIAGQPCLVHRCRTHGASQRAPPASSYEIRV